MANTVHGPYSPKAFSAGNSFASGDANTLGTQAGVALASFNPDLITAGFVLSGVTCVKDGTTASQLDVASGRAYLIVSDGTLARIDVASTTFSTSGHPSTTMYLDLNPDGSWSWATSHSAVANHLTICSVTTDGSSNISTVTDARVTAASLLSGMVGQLSLPTLSALSVAGAATFSGNATFSGFITPANDGSHGLNGDLLLGINSSPKRYGLVLGDGSGWRVPLYTQPGTGGAKTQVGYIGDDGGWYGNVGNGPLSAAGSTTSLTLSGTPADVSGFTITIPTAGTYLVIGSVYCDIGGSGTAGQAVIYLNVNGTRQNLTGELSMATAATNMTLNANVTQTWVVSVGAGQVVKLQASGTNGFANVVPNGGTVASSLVAQYLHS